MASIIDAFVITMGLDGAGVKAGAKDINDSLRRTGNEADSVTSKMESAGKRTANAFVGLKNEVIGFFLALTGLKGLKDFTLGIVNSDASLGRFSSNIGISTRDVGAWSAAVQEMGGSANDAMSAIGKMAHIRAQMQMGQRPDNSGILQMFGINQTNANDESAMLMQISRASQRMSPLLFNEMAGQLGFSPEMISLLRKGPDYLQQNMGKWNAYGDELKKNAEASQHLQSAFADLRLAIETKLRPAIEGLASFIDWLLTQKKTAQSMADPSTWVAVKQGDGAELKKRAADPKNPYGKGLLGGLKAMWNDDWVSVHDNDAAPPVHSGGASPAAKEVVSSGARGNLARYAAYFRAQGFTLAQSLGIAAGILAESRGDPTAVNKKSGAFGLGQWLGDRKKRLFAQFGPNPDEKAQLQFLAWELKGGDPGGKYVGAAQDADTAGLAYLSRFMRPQGRNNEHMGDLLGDVRRMRSFLVGASATRQESTINIGTITIVNPKDAQDVARNLRSTLKSRSLGLQADGPYN